MLKISVVIPTLNRAHLLEACLKSLIQQTLSPEDYEICVVDNGSADDTQKVIKELTTKIPTSRVFTVTEPELGVSSARNRGIKETSAPLVAFCDDDILVSSDWLERYIARFSTLPLDTVKIGGELEPIWENTCPDWINRSNAVPSLCTFQH